MSFDTLQYAKRMQKAGFTAHQAEAQAEAIKELIDERLATKEDLKRTEKRLEDRIDLMGYKITYKLTIRFGAMLVGTVAIVGVLVPLMMKFLH